MFRNISPILTIIVMIEDKDIVFVTTTLYTKWLEYQTKLVKKEFPGSQHVIVDGTSNWPNSWFNWINQVKGIEAKYYVHLDEDFFIKSGYELRKAIQKLSTDGIDLLGVSDGFHHYRGANHVAINTFLMIGKLSDLKNMDFTNIKFNLTDNGWINDMDLKFSYEYLERYPFTGQSNGTNLEYEQEPYYAFMWKLKKAGKKFGYLYPHFDNYYKSTNPRISEESNDIGIHMWYTRTHESNMDVWGVPNKERYRRVEEFLKNDNIQ